LDAERRPDSFVFPETLIAVYFDIAGAEGLSGSGSSLLDEAS